MNLKKLLSVATLFVTSALGFNANAQASYNFTYNEGVAVTEGTDYFLYNVGAKRFLTDGMDWGTHATVDNAGRVITLTSLGEGKYSIYTKTFTSDEKKGYMTLNGYLDTGSNDANWEFTSVELNGYTNVYTIKHSDSEYLYYDNNDSRVQVGNSTENEYSYWMLVPKTVRDTKGDYTYLLQNTDFNRPWERVIWINEAGFTNQSGGLESNRCAEVYKKEFDMKQDVNYSLPKGLYTVSCQGFYRTESGEDSPAVLYANSEAGESTANFNKIVSGQEDNMGDASTSFSAGNHAVSLSVVMEGNFTVGIKNTAPNWVIFDNFFLKCEDLFLSAVATPFTGSGSLEANKWYVYDVINSVAHNFSSIDDIVYTQTDALQGGAITKEADSKVELTAGKLYFKSTVSQELSITPEYYVSKATTDVKYIQKDNVITVSYDVSTTNLEANLNVNFDGVTFDGKAIEINTTSNGFTFTIPEVSANTSYILSIPADAIGYEGHLCNEAQEITLNTPAIFDGYYYLKNNHSDDYLSRGGTWATRALMDDYGLAVYLATDHEGKTTIKYFDNQLFLYKDNKNGWCWADGTEGLKLSVSKVEGGYKFLNIDLTNSLGSNHYLGYYGDGDNYAMCDGVENSQNIFGEGPKQSNVWTIETPDEHKENYTANANAQAAAAATAATNAGLIGLSEITTVSALEAYLASLDSKNVTITGSEAEKYQQYAYEEQTLREFEYYKETVSGLTPGIYKLSVDAFQRAAWNEWVANADGARGSIYVYANDVKTQIKSVMEYGADEPYVIGNDFGSNGKYYPNNYDGGLQALNTDKYRNDVYVYVADGGDGTGSLTFGIKNPNRPGKKLTTGTWAMYKNFTLTYYGTAVANMTITEGAGWATFIAPFDVEIPEGVKAYTVSGVEGTILTKEEVDKGTIPANTPVLLKDEEGLTYTDGKFTKTFYGQNANQDTYDGGVLVGNVSGVTKNVPNNGESFVLLMQGGNLGFYKVATDDIKVDNNRCYLNVPSAGVKAFFFGDEATGINGITDDATVVERYNAAGMKVAAPVKGLNIVKLSNGKVQKVLVK